MFMLPRENLHFYRYIENIHNSKILNRETLGITRHLYIVNLTSTFKSIYLKVLTV